MEGLVDHAPMTALLRERGVFERHPFVLLDIGCAGGIDAAWRSFGPSLVAHGYDPDIDECKYAQGEPFENVHYHARFVGLPDDHPFVQRRRADAAQWPDTNIWGRVTASHPAVRQRSAVPESSSQVERPALIGVDGIVHEERLPTVDFLKVDVDGTDLEVLESARTTFAEQQILGVGIEVNWFGTANPSEHTFHNTDVFLRREGYSLFGLTVRRYSRAHLPAPFEHEAFAQTRFGQPYQGDAIYLRDLAAPHEADLAGTYAAEKLLKLACIYELTGLPDCAVEILNKFSPRLGRFGDPEPLLDALTPPLLGQKLTYREYVAAFEAQPELFLPSAEGGAGPAANRKRAPALHRRVGRLARGLRELRG